MRHTRIVLAVLLVSLAARLPAFAQAPVIEYYHVDALGSVRAVTDASGAVLRTQNYHPFGEGVGVAPGGDPMGFTGKPRDAETGLDYFGARYYAQRTGRFTTVDPAMLVDRNLTDPQSWNRYSYTKNNPMRYIDRDGRIWETLWDVGNLAYSGYQCLTGKGCGAVAWDAAATLVPFIPAGGGRLLGLADEGVDAARAARQLPAISNSTIETALTTAAARVNSQDTHALNGLKSHIDRGDLAFRGMAKTSDAALNLIKNILTNPSQLEVTKSRINVFNAAGQGVRLTLDGKFIGFLSGQKK